MAKSFNPLTTFRKNQKVSLAFITLLSMFAFVCVGPSMFGRSNNGGGPNEGNVAATWNYGTISQTEVGNRLVWRQRINKFLRLIDETVNKANPDAIGRVTQFQPETHDGILDAILLEKKAELLGMTVSDDAINDFINSVSDKSLDREALNTALTTAVNDPRASANQLSDQLFDALRFELLARNFGVLLTSDAIDYDTPEQRWDFFSRLYREATVQVLPVSVSDFVGKVPTPSNEELQRMFDKYKDQLKRPTMPEPGFMVPAQAKFQYFKAVPADFLKAAEAKITDKQINDYYEKHKESYRKSSLDESETPPVEAPKTPATPKTGANASPATGEKSKAAESAKSPAAKSPAPKSDDKSKPADKTKTDGKTPPATTSGKSSDVRPAARHFSDNDLLALADTTPQASAAKSDAAKTDAAKSASAKADSTKAAAKPDAVKSEPAKIPPPKVEPPKAGPTASTPPVAKTAPAKTAPAMPATSTDDEFQSVNDPKLRGRIRTTLATEAVTSQINDAFAKIRTEVQVFGRQHMDWVGNGSVGEAPASPDFKAVAKANGFTFGDTPMMSADEAPDVNELGKSSIFSSETFTLVPFGAVGFDPNLPSYMPSQSATRDISYLWWRTDFTKAYVPNFVDVKPQVTLAWKMTQARILAMKEAQKDAEDANKRRATLKVVFQNRPNRNVSEIGPFPWLSIGNVSLGTTTQQRISLTNLSGVDMAGEEFMHAVFKNEVGSASAAFNQPQTVAYVVQLQKLEPSEDMFRRQFLTYQEQTATMPGAGPAFAAARGAEQQFVVPAKLQAIRDELGFKQLATAASSGSQSGGQQEAPSDEDD